MSVITNNIIVGAGDLYFSSDLTTAVPALTTKTQTVREAFEADVNWTHLGATEGGVELSYEPSYGDVFIDQYKDSARLFLEQQTFNFSTNLMEATLENLLLAWGFDDSALVAGTPTTDGETQRFNLGVATEDPCEYKFAIVSKGAAEDVQPGCAAGEAVERLYVARRVVSVSGSTLALRRSEATMFPTSFRMLPYAGTTGEPVDAAEAYGYILDRQKDQITP